ncbi:MAG: asparaginase [Pyrinomonadaceae bacterium]|nr:asparaginase [Pyrinomonadaceae bacterium]
MSRNDKQSKNFEPELLVEVRRGPITESRHRGHVIVVDGDGSEIARLGEPETVTYLRSSAKPFQALPFITSGAADHLGFSAKELAVACGSHSGEPIHTETVAAMLQRIGLEASVLKCGTHEPFSREAARRLREQGQSPNLLHNNCSGKHTAMVALALHLGAPIASYDQPDNPVQLMIARMVEQFSGVPVGKIVLGIDGCGVPVFGISVRAMALMYARLVTPPADFDDKKRGACQQVVAAMLDYPEMIGGTTERLDTEVMRAAPKRLVSKVGAEGVYTAGILPCEQWPRGLGIAIKIEDGDDRRARPTVVIETLRQLSILRDQELEALAPYAGFPLRNHSGTLVGNVHPCFNLQRVNKS